MTFEDAAAELPLEPKEVEADTLTLACDFCGEQLYKVRKSRLESAKQGAPLERSDLEDIHDITKSQRDSFVLMDCPVCGGNVFSKNYYGGFNANTVEEGLFPNERRASGFRMRSFRWGDPYNTLEPVRQRMSSLGSGLRDET